MMLYFWFMIKFLDLNKSIMKSIVINLYSDYSLKIVYIMSYFLTIFILFNEFCNILFHFFEITVLLNNFNCICNFFMIVFHRNVILTNAIPYLFNKNT